jgi:hypothetical protein
MEMERELASMNATLKELREEVMALRQVMAALLTEAQRGKLRTAFGKRRPRAPRHPAVTSNSLPPTATAASHERYDSGGS